MLQLYAQTPKTKLTAAQMLTAARNRNTRIWSQAGLSASCTWGWGTPKPFITLSDIC